MRFWFFLACLVGIAAGLTPLNSGAIVSNRTEHPWIALLFITEAQSSNEYVCGGSLVGSEWIMTAAHCVYPGRSNLLSPSITAFLHEKYTEVGGSWVTLPVVTAAKIIPHPQYDPRTFTNDVALIQISQKINTIEPLKFSFRLADWQNLLQQNPLPNLVQSGYGKSSDASSAGTVMHKIQLQPEPWSVGGGCGGWDRSVVHGDYCAINRLPVGGIIQQPCAGDSGSALFADTKPPIGYGIVSRGEDTCSDGTLPDIFSAVSQSSMASFVFQYISPASISPTAILYPPSQPPPPPPSFKPIQSTFYFDWFPSGYTPKKLTLIFFALCILQWR